jgi:hypothetical protein
MLRKVGQTSDVDRLCGTTEIAANGLEMSTVGKGQVGSVECRRSDGTLVMPKQQPILCTFVKCKCD